MSKFDTRGYKEISKAESLDLPAEQCCHAAHGMLYAPWPGKLFGRYEFHYAVMKTESSLRKLALKQLNSQLTTTRRNEKMQMRFDGTMGFPGGIIDSGETPEQTVSREFMEEVSSGEEFSEDDHVVTYYSKHTKLCLHFFAKEIILDKFHEIEKRAPMALHWGEEVLGIVRCPLYTLPNGLGFPAFLRNQFIGNAKEQLLATIERRGLLSQEEIRVAVKKSGSVHGNVTLDDIDY